MDEVEIQETSLIYPSPSFSDKPQDHHPETLPLSHLDNDRNLHVTFRTLRAYAALPNPNPDPSLSDPADVIAQALSKALLHYSPLAATLLLRSSDARLELRRASGQGVPLTRASSDRTIASLSDPGSPLLDRLVPDLVSGEELAHPLAVQVTRFACGGFSLGMCVHHSMCDGMGSTQFLSAVAEFARGSSGPAVEPVWDRAVLLGPRTPPRVEVPFHEFLEMDGDLSRGPYESVDLDSCHVVRECFHVSEACLDRFRSRLSQESGSTFTTFETLGAFIWRARVMARGIPGEEKVRFAYSMNIRKVLKPPLPSGYWGNCCVPVYVELSARELVERPAWETAERIKKSKHSVTDEYVRSYIDFQELHYAEGISAGKGVSGFTDWRHLGHSAVDFGWGGPVTVWPLSWKLLGSVEPCFFLPYASVGGRKEEGFRALVSLPEKAMPAFRLEMEMLRG